jgi:rhamnosyltransferase
LDLIDYQSTANIIIAVLVLYKTRLEDSEAFVSLSNSLKKGNFTMDIVVYDNSPTPMVTDTDSVSDSWRIHYVHDRTNPGVSKAYNEGLRIAKKLNKQWLLLLDQDTCFSENAFVEYSKAIQENQDIYLFAPIVISENRIISPNRYFLNRGYRLRKVKPGVYNFHTKSLINSGMCINTRAFEKAGGYNEKIRLDFADHSFIARYKANYSKFVVINLWCSQGFSGKQCLTLDSALVRFALYCEGARNKAVNKLDYCVLMVVIILRSTHLSLKYTNARFFRVAIEVFWAGKSANAAK